MLSISTEAWEVTFEAEWVWEEEEETQNPSLGDGSQEDVKYLQKKRRPNPKFHQQHRRSPICHLSVITGLHPLHKLFMPAAKCIHTILFTLLLHFYSALFHTFVYKNKSLL